VAKIKWNERKKEEKGFKERKGGRNVEFHHLLLSNSTTASEAICAWSVDAAGCRAFRR